MDLQKISALRIEIQAKQAALLEEIRTLFGEGAKEVFAENPQLVSFGWNQYTPSWNDGDPCHFSSYHEYPKLTIKFGEEEVEFDTDGDGRDPSEYENGDEIFNKAELATSSFLGNFTSDDYLGLFGNNTSVTITPDGKAIISDYEDTY